MNNYYKNKYHYYNKYNRDKIAHNYSHKVYKATSMMYNYMKNNKIYIQFDMAYMISNTNMMSYKNMYMLDR
jgi:hypothetical protein